jgi:ribosomal protein L30E
MLAIVLVEHLIIKLIIISSNVKKKIVLFQKITYNYTSDLYVDIIVLKSTLKTGFYVLFTNRCYQLFGPLNTDKSKHLVISV